MRTSIYLFLAALPLLLVACDSSPMFTEPTPEATLEPTPETTLEPTPEVTPTPVATPTALPEPVLLPAGPTTESTENVPCTPASGSVVDPCEPGPSVAGQPGGAGTGSSRPLGPEILDLGGYLTVGQTLHAHIVARGTYLPDTVRCLAHGESRLPPQRDRSRGARTIKCYAEVRVHEYVIGSGPPALTVIAYVFYYLNFYEIGDYALLPPDKENETEQEYIERIRVFHEQRLDGGEDNIEGREAILFLGPSRDIQVEAWEIMHQWRLERMADDTVVVVHPARDDWRVRRDDFQQYRSQLEMELPAFRQAATAAHEARVAANGGRTRPEPDFPMLVSDVNRLGDYFREVGAYDDPDNPPAQPPPPYGSLEYLTEEIPPCTPAPGSTVDPCERLTDVFGIPGPPGSFIWLGDEPPRDIQYFLTGESKIDVPHVVVRGTYLPDTVRCTTGNLFQPPAYLGQNNLRDIPFIYCYADVRVNAYVLGSGPSRLTVLVYWYIRTGPGEEEVRLSLESVLSRGNPDRMIQGITGREAMLFIGPSPDASIDSWQVMNTWDVQRMPDGTVVAVHPLRKEWEELRDDWEQYVSQLEVTLPSFGAAVATAHEARLAANGGRTRPDPTFPMLVSDANRLSDYFREVGAYDDPDNPPAQPPPPYGPLEYLMEEIPPCTPVPGSSVDPCEVGEGLLNATGSVSLLTVDYPDVPYAVPDYLNSFGWFDYGIAHLVVRGTYLPGTVRCTSANSFLPPSHIADGGANPLLIYCYSDVRVNEYIVGMGPSVLTVIAAHQSYGRDGVSAYGHEEVEILRSLWERALVEGGQHRPSPSVSRNPWLVASGPPGGIAGREAVLFLGPSSSASLETWRVYAIWDVQRRGDETVVAVHPDFYSYVRIVRDDATFERLLPQLELELPTFKQAAQSANNARVTANNGRVRPDPDFPMLVSDANQLSTYFREVGAYDDPDNPPAQPPPPCGLAVPDQADNPGLMQDCMALLAAKDALRGTASLNWSVERSITEWDGVTTSGTPLRVTRLELPDKSLSGSVPAELGRLSGLAFIRLAGNSFTGCVPYALRNVADSDLGSVGISYCAGMGG